MFQKTNEDSYYTVRRLYIGGDIRMISCSDPNKQFKRVINAPRVTGFDVFRLQNAREMTTFAVDKPGALLAADYTVVNNSI